MKLTDSPKCIYGDHDNDTAEHTILECKRWTYERNKLMESLNTEKLTYTNLVPTMLKSNENWKAVREYMEALISAKENEAKRFGK